MSTKLNSDEIMRQKLLNCINSKRKRPAGSVKNPKNSAAIPHTKSDENLTRKAIDEIQKESIKGAVRASLAGPSGWQRVPQVNQGNKRLLQNTIRSAIAHNRRLADPSCGGVTRKSERELDATIAGGKQRQAKFGKRKHCFRKVHKSKDLEIK